MNTINQHCGWFDKPEADHSLAVIIHASAARGIGISRVACGGHRAEDAPLPLPRGSMLSGDPPAPPLSGTASRVAAGCSARGAFKYGGNGQHWLQSSKRLCEALKVGWGVICCGCQLCGQVCGRHASKIANGKASWVDGNFKSSHHFKITTVLVVIVICARCTCLFASLTIKYALDLNFEKGKKIRHQKYMTRPVHASR